MICLVCRDGGSLQVVLAAAPSVVQEKHREATFELASELHAACKGGTWCDCLHAGFPNDRRGETR